MLFFSSIMLRKRKYYQDHSVGPPRRNLIDSTCSGINSLDSYRVIVNYKEIFAIRKFKVIFKPVLWVQVSYNLLRLITVSTTDQNKSV